MLLPGRKTIMITDTYEAHPGEPWIDHTLLVADLAEQFGKRAGCEKPAIQAGLFHDLGKRTKKFVKILLRQITKVDHAIIGAQLYSLLADENICDDEYVYVMIQRVVAGHHSCYIGSRNDYENSSGLYPLPEDFSRRMITEDDGKEQAWSSEEEFDALVEYIDDHNLLIPITASDHPDFDSTNDPYHRMMYERMLYSCLVDADYTATAEYVDHEKYTGEHFLDSGKCLLTLESYYSSTINTDPEKPINKLRAEVYRDATVAGQNYDPGLYTMTAPTGLGKTLALIRFALEQAKRNEQDRIFVVLPYLSIIEQNTNVYKDIFGDEIVLESDSNIETDERLRSIADRWNAPIIVTTSVKFFHTLFCSHVAGLRALHQVANSVIVFDESQTLPDKVLTCSMLALKSLSDHFHTTVLLSTATQPQYHFRKQLEGFRDVKEVIGQKDFLYDRYNKIKNTKVDFDILKGHVYSFEELDSIFKDQPRCLFVLNTTNKARNFYLYLKDKVNRQNVFLLTSSFIPARKREIIKTVSDMWKRGEPCALVSTQCIEAGVDIDAPCGFREYAPLPSIIQTAGRINRNGNGKGYLLIGVLAEEKYPEVSYANGAHISMAIARENPDLNINSLESIRDYYEAYFNHYNEDKIELKTAIGNEDLIDIQSNYRLIDDSAQATIIVPDPLQRKLFIEASTALTLSQYCLKQKDMVKWRPCTMNVFLTSKTRELVDTHCHQLYFHTVLGKIPTTWYIADMDKVYDEKIGLCVQRDGINFFSV